MGLTEGAVLIGSTAGLAVAAASAIGVAAAALDAPRPRPRDPPRPRPPRSSLPPLPRPPRPEIQHTITYSAVSKRRAGKAAKQKRARDQHTATAASATGCVLTAAATRSASCTHAIMTVETVGSSLKQHKSVDRVSGSGEEERTASAHRSGWSSGSRCGGNTSVCSGGGSSGIRCDVGLFCAG